MSQHFKLCIKTTTGYYTKHTLHFYFLIHNSWQPDVVDLRYFNLWILLVQITRLKNIFQYLVIKLVSLAGLKLECMNSVKHAGCMLDKKFTMTRYMFLGSDNQFVGLNKKG